MTTRLVTIILGDKPTRSEMTMDASKIGAGMPATVCHPNDRYAAKVLSVSRSGHQLTVRYDNEHLGDKVFTWRQGREGVGYFAEQGASSPRLALGVAETYLCPEI